MGTNANETGFTLVNMIVGKWTTHLLATAATLGIGDVLASEPLGADEVAARTRTHPPSIRRFLRALANLGLLQQGDGGRYALTELGSLLRADVAGSTKALAMMIGSAWHNRCWEQLPEMLRTGRSGAELAFGESLWAYFDGAPEDFAVFNEAMTAATATMHEAAAEAYDFSGIGTLVDVGGGHGRLLGTILTKHAEMRGILFDRPPLAAGAKAELTRLGIADRCEFVGGDFFQAVPPGGDVYMMAHVVHDWPDPDSTRILSNCRAVMRPGSRLLVLDAVIRSDGAQDWGKLMDLEMFVIFGGRDRTREELAALLMAAGFQLERIIPTRSSTSITEAIAL